ncbi:helix-turn-helix domain-containing protein [Thermogemmatispora sp.]|uniref:helix-turn-helix domain-containing protein n=1 Tax=Thermogemmatispora sp. TaxID=1968838 RepID=UPI0035E4636B
MYRLRLHVILHQRRLSAQWLAQRTSLPEATISRMLKDPFYMPPASTLVRIARALHIPAEELLEELPDR